VRCCPHFFSRSFLSTNLRVPRASTRWLPQRPIQLSMELWLWSYAAEQIPNHSRLQRESLVFSTNFFFFVVAAGCPYFSSHNITSSLGVSAGAHAGWPSVMSSSLLSRSKSKWDDAGESLGTFIGRFPGTRYQCWEAKGKAREAFNKLSSEIKECLQASNTTPAADIVTWSIYMIGKTENTASPKVLICSTDQKDRKRVRRIIKEGKIMEKYPGIGLGDTSTLPDRHVIRELAREAIKALIPPDIPIDAKGVVLAENSSCQVGMQLFAVDESDYSLRPITAGPFVYLGGSLYDLTIAHSFSKKQPIPPDGRHCSTYAPVIHQFTQDYGFESMKDLSFEGMSNDESIHDNDSMWSALSEISASSNEIGLDEEDKSSTDRANLLPTTSNDASNSASPDFSVSYQDDVQDDSEMASTAVTPYRPRDLDISNLQYFGRLHLDSFADKPSVDNALIRVNGNTTRDLMLHVGTEDLQHITRVGIIGKEDMSVMAVMRRGLVRGSLTATPAYICLRGQVDFQLVYPARLRTIAADGDCGSAIVDQDGHSFYGHVVAGGLGSNIFYLVPATETVQSIQAQTGMEVKLSLWRNYLGERRQLDRGEDLTSPSPRLPTAASSDEESKANQIRTTNSSSSLQVNEDLYRHPHASGYLLQVKERKHTRSGKSVAVYNLNERNAGFDEPRSSDHACAMDFKKAERRAKWEERAKRKERAKREERAEEEEWGTMIKK
jgi:hypothetical protein